MVSIIIQSFVFEVVILFETVEQVHILHLLELILKNIIYLIIYGLSFLRFSTVSQAMLLSRHPVLSP